MQQQPDAMTELIAAGKRIGHLVSLVGVLTVAAVVLVCAAVLVWSYLPVHEAATWDLGEGVLFLILPYPLGDSQWTGAGAIGLGAVLLAMGLLLLWVAYDGRFRGLSGFGTSFLGLVTVASGIGFLAWGGWLGSQGHLTAAVTAANWLPVPVGFLELRNWELAQWHAVLIGAILMSLAVLAIKDGPPMLRALRDASRTGALPGMRTDNGWIIIFRVYLGMLFFYLVYYAILGLFQVSTNVPAFEDEPVWSQLYTFANASVWEEILSRTLMLGLPLLLYYRFARRPRPVPRHRFLIGGGIPIDTAAFALVVFSGTVFALAHVNGWDFWKVLPTAITGFFFGYLFLRLGLWAAIILHFTFDYIDVSSQVLGAGVANALGLVQLLWIFAGLILCVHYVVVLYQSGPGEVRRALGRVAPAPASVAAASTVAPPAATPPVVAPPAAAAPTAGVGEGGPGAGGASGPPPAGPGPGPG